LGKVGGWPSKPCKGKKGRRAVRGGGVWSTKPAGGRESGIRLAKSCERRGVRNWAGGDFAARGALRGTLNQGEGKEPGHLKAVPCMKRKKKTQHQKAVIISLEGWQLGRELRKGYSFEIKPRRPCRKDRREGRKGSQARKSRRRGKKVFKPEKSRSTTLQRTALR